MRKQATVFFIRIIGFGIVCYNSQSYAVNWTVNPFVQAQEIYSDNIRLAPANNQKSAFVTNISPGVSVIGRSARSRLNLNYHMQNLYNAHGDGQLNTFNQLQASSNTVLMPNRLFLNARSSISQQNINNSQIANDNISGSGSRTNVSTFGFAPTWTPRFGNYANGNVQVNFDMLTTGMASPANTNAFSDTLNVGENIRLNSGTEFKRVSWGLSFNNAENNRASNGGNVSFQNSSAIIRTFLNRHFNIFAQGGYSNNDFQTVNNNTNNGFSYTVGGRWKPSNYYSIEAGYGNNKYVTVNLSPTRRLNWVTTYRDNDIGLNSGQTWQTALNYRTRRSKWTLSHNNDTTTTQAILLQQQLVTVDVNPDPLINQPLQFLVNIPTLTNEVIVRKMWNLSASYYSGKSTVGASAFSEDRDFQVTAQKEKVSGISANWNWQFASRTSAYLTPRWQQIDRASAAKDNRYDIVVGLSSSITRHLNGRIELRHLDQTSDITANNFQENRATASLFMRF